MGRIRRTFGGVHDHAVSRIQKQYNSPADRGEIRKILREEKNNAKIKNGYFTISKEATKKLKIESRQELFGLVTGGVVLTVVGKTGREHTREVRI